MPLTDWLDFAVELGLDGVEGSPMFLRPRGPVTPTEFRKLAEARKLVVSSHTCYSDFTQPDPEAREREVAAMIQNARDASELGAATVRALTGQAWPGVSEAQGVAWVVDGVRRAAEAADKLGVRVVIENHTKAFVWDYYDFAQRGEVFLKVLDGLKGAPVSVQFDTGNPLVAGEDVLALFERVKDRIGFLHVNDVAEPGAFRFVPVGTGISPIREVLARLRAQGYAGWVSIEEASRTGRPGFQQAVSFMRRSLAEGV